MSEEEIIQEIEKLELEEEKEKVIKKLLGIVIEGKKDIIQEKEFFLKKKEQEIERLNSIIKTDNIINKERADLIEQQRKEIEELKKPKYLYNTNTGEITRIENEKGIDKNKIEKLSTEIEELKKDKKALVKNYDKVLSNFISKNTISEKIKEIKIILDELLEE